MAPLLGTVLAFVLGGLGLLHLIWAAGLSFPFPNEQSLARSVVGRRGITRLPSHASVALLGVLLLGGGAAAVIMGHFEDAFPPLKYLLVPVGLFLSGVFFIRAVVGVLPAFERAAPEQPYLTLNRRLYSPLCFLIGLAFLALTFSLPNWSWRLAQVFG
ncbi:DUF3995 domain-containing protein [Hyphomonas sp. WL0036]|uniref:DUF3995 domain-containing protein n=1 Tax=Hyphomonas sediminis TaxID=2866160 RepID=UPI001C7E555B|nr:DUF3995 domain-containing protein [Hyphomonas sediminis]